MSVLEETRVLPSAWASRYTKLALREVDHKLVPKLLMLQLRNYSCLSWPRIEQRLLAVL